MFDNLDILINRFEPNKCWMLGGQTLNDLNDSDEQPEHYVTETFYDDQFDDGDARKHAIIAAERIGCEAVKSGEVRRAVIILEGNEYKVIEPSLHDASTIVPGS